MELANELRRYRRVAGRSPGAVSWLLLAGTVAMALLAVMAVVLRIAAQTGAGEANAVHSALLRGETGLMAAQGAVLSAAARAVRALVGTIVVCAPFLLIEVVAHEMGHVLAGRLVGFRFVFCTIGPLKLTATGRGLALGYSENWVKVAGSAASVPTHPHNARLRELVRIAGGPIASLLVGSIAAALAMTTAGTAHRLCELAAITSLLSFGANVLPFRSGGSLSDGARIKMLLFNKQQAERYCSIMALIGAARHGQRPREWDARWMAQATALADGSRDDITANHLAYYWCMDIGDVAGGALRLERAVAASGGAHVPPRLRWMVLADAAFFHAYYRGDAQTASAFLQAAGQSKAARDRFMQLRAEAAALLAEGKRAEARERAVEGLALMDREGLGEAGWQLDREWLEALAGIGEQRPPELHVA